MKIKLLIVLTAAMLLLMPNVNFAQSPPDLGSASNFALFTATGAFSNSGASTFVTGDVGTNVGAFSAFPPGILVGQVHVADPASAAAATDVDDAYGDMNPITCGSVISTTMGGGQMLLPNVYCLGAASTINGDLILDGQGDPTSLFIFKINGALATTVHSRVLLTNSASMCNVYWQVNGEVDLGDSSLFQGTMLVNGAINLLEGATLIGRGLSRAGAISLHNNTVTLVLQPVASAISADGAITFCEGDSTVLTGNIDGVWSNGSTASSITVKTGADFFVTNTNGCGSDTSNHIIVTVNPLPVASAISGGATTFCEGGSVVLSGNSGGTWSNGATTSTITVTASGDYFVTNTNGCGSVISNHISVTVNPLATASTITAGGAITFCAGDSVVLSGNSGGTWSNGSTSASLTVTTSGNYFVTNTNSCGGVISNHIIVTVNPCTSNCLSPVIISIDSICGNVASICWTPVAGAIGYIVQWNTLPRTTWIVSTVSAPDTCLQFTNHFGDVNQLQVATICANGDTSAFSSLVTWTDYLVCAAPEGQSVSNITATSADLSWTANPDANKYTVLYKIGSNKTTVKVSGTTLSLTGLPPSTTIKWRVKSRCKNCGTNSWGTYSPFQSFTTASLKEFAIDQPSACTLLVFPNPANVNFTVSFKVGYPSQQSYTLTIQDVVGHIIIAEDGTLTDGSLSQNISLTSGMSNGIYFVTITTDGKQFRERLVVTRD